MFIWENESWPRFTWDRQSLERPLVEVHRKQAVLLARMEGAGPVSLLSSAEPDGLADMPPEITPEIAPEIAQDIARGFRDPLTPLRLAVWHQALFPGTGTLWRTDDRTGAPPVERLELEMTVFLHWFNTTQPVDLILKAGLAHLWFVTIHPFDDGNGRIARAIADMTLARADESPQRFYSMSAQIRRERDDYYAALEAAQRATTDITDWLTWFLGCLARAIDGAQTTLAGVMQTSRFWDQHRGVAFNDRQRKVLALLLEDFEGKLTTSKWAKLTQSSQDTAYRDILDLIAKGILAKEDSGGRSTNYRML